MIKVIRPRTRRNVECINCGAILSYEDEDIKQGTNKAISSVDFQKFGVPYKYIICPECGQEIQLVATR